MSDDNDIRPIPDTPDSKPPSGDASPRISPLNYFQEPRLRRVYSARDGLEAHFVKGLIESEDIHVVIQGETLGAVLGDVPLSTDSSPTLWVDQSDVPAALRIIGEMKQGGPAAINPGPKWTCANCNEQLEGQFSSCWKCGAPRSESV
jgi:Putative prokaryotic signal transducing protein